MQLSMGMFMGLIFIVGLVLTIYAFKISPLVNKCSNKSQNSVRGLLTIGIMMISFSLMYMVCDCGIKVKTGTIGMLFVIVMFVLGIITITLLSIIHAECKEAQKNTPFLLSLSVMTTVLSSGYLIYIGYLMSCKENKRVMEVEMGKLNFS